MGDLKIQPVEFTVDHELDTVESTITKVNRALMQMGLRFDLIEPTGTHRIDYLELTQTYQLVRVS